MGLFYVIQSNLLLVLSDAFFNKSKAKTKTSLIQRCITSMYCIAGLAILIFKSVQIQYHIQCLIQLLDT